MSMIDSIVLLWRSPSLFRWDRFCFWNIFNRRSYCSKLLVFIKALQMFFWHWTK